jgi:hypothetical protein
MAPPRPCSFRLDEDLLDWVREYAKRRDAAMSAVVEGALLDFRKKVDRLDARSAKGPPLPERVQPVGSRRPGPKGQPAPVEKPSWA